MSELIVAGFDDAHTAYLVRGALARMQDTIPIEGHGVALVYRQGSGKVEVRKAIDLSLEGEDSEAFWKALMGLIFAPSGVDKARYARERLAAIGIDAAFLTAVAKRVRPGTLAVAVIASEAARDRVIGLFQGFRAETSRIRLIGDDRKEWMARLLGS